MVRMLESRLAKFVVSLAILTVLIFLFGFPYKLVMEDSWYVGFWSTCTKWSSTVLRIREEVFSIFNINHMMGGSIILGLGSLFTSTMSKFVVV